MEAAQQVESKNDDYQPVLFIASRTELGVFDDPSPKDLLSYYNVRPGFVREFHHDWIPSYRFPLALQNEELGELYK